MIQRIAVSRGLTMLEVLAVLAIVFISASIAVANFVPILEKRALDTTTDDFIQSIALAQQLALKSSDFVVICPGVEAGKCTGSDWNNGWVIAITDRNLPSQPLVVVRRSESLKYKTRLKWDEDQLVINSNGLIVLPIDTSIDVCTPSLNNYWSSLELEFTQALRRDQFYTGEVVDCT